MADNSGGIGILGVVIGAAIVIALGFFLLNGNFNTGGTKSVNLTVNCRRRPTSKRPVRQAALPSCARSCPTRGTARRSSSVQIPNRLAFGTQGANVLLRDDLARQAVNLVTLRRRPAAKLLHALQKAEPQDLRIFADSDEA